MADTAGGVTSIGKASVKYMCGTPVEDCGGSNAILSASFKGKLNKVHNSSTEAFNCHKRYLLKNGWTQIGSRAFEPPPKEDGTSGGPARVLTKKSRFGGRMRGGKGNRNMPSKPRTGGIIKYL